MKKPFLISIIIIVVIVAIVSVARLSNTQEGLQNGNTSPKDATYLIDGKSITLVNGVFEENIPDSSSKIVTQYFGNEVRHDFNSDGREDTAFLLTQNSGGTGTFYYIVVALNTPRGYVGGEGFLIGDRIAPQTTEMGKGNIIVVNYADRKEGESFAVQPSVGKSISVLLDPKTMQLGEVVNDFEGEADPAKMTLDMKSWNWVSTVYKDGKIVVPKDSTRFVLTFKGNNFSAKTDCNGVGGEYVVNGSKISFEKMMSTLMYCEGSQESDFSKMMSEVQSYHFTSKGELVFSLKLDGEMVFR